MYGYGPFGLFSTQLPSIMTLATLSNLVRNSAFCTVDAMLALKRPAGSASKSL